MPLITVFTATYNRAGLLRRLFESLERQTHYDFEWIVIDDGSSDATVETMEAIRSKELPFSVRFEVQEHGGKHRAINKGVGMAKGDWFFIVDSDDYIVPDAISIASSWIIDAKDNPMIAGVAGICATPSGEAIGEVPDLQAGCFIEASNLERHKLNLLGDKAEIYRTEVLAKHPFPEIAGEVFVTERYCWDAIAAEGYKIRWYNEPIYRAEYLDEGLTKSGANSLKGHIENYCGYCLFVEQSIRLWEPTEAITIFREYNQVANYMDIPFNERPNHLGVPRTKYAILWGLMPALYAVRLAKRAIRK